MRDLWELVRRWAEGGVVVDVGCGSGAALSEAMRNTRALGVGVDVDLGRLTRGRAARPGNVDLVQADARLLPIRDGSARVVVAALALHELRPGEGVRCAVMEVARVLEPGGRFVVLDKFLYPPADEAERNSLMWESLRHEVARLTDPRGAPWGLHAESDYVRLIEGAGLRVVSRAAVEVGGFLSGRDFARVVSESRVAEEVERIRDPEARERLRAWLARLLERAARHGYRRSRLLLLVAEKPG